VAGARLAPRSFPTRSKPGAVDDDSEPNTAPDIATRRRSKRQIAPATLRSGGLQGQERSGWPCDHKTGPSRWSDPATPLRGLEPASGHRTVTSHASGPQIASDPGHPQNRRKSCAVNETIAEFPTVNSSHCDTTSRPDSAALKEPVDCCTLNFS